MTATFKPAKSTTFAGAFQDADAALLAIFSGKSTITLRSATGTHYTYKVEKGDKRHPADKDVWFLKVLTGADNEHSYSYAGMLQESSGSTGFSYRTTAASKVGMEAPSIKAFCWAIGKMASTAAIPAGLEIWHSGACCRCGRKLTVPTSIKTGLGPDCAGMVLGK